MGKKISISLSLGNIFFFGKKKNIGNIDNGRFVCYDTKRIYIEGEGEAVVNINGAEKEINLNEEPYIEVPACESGYEVSIRKKELCDFPVIVAVSVQKSDFSALIEKELKFALDQSMLMYEAVRPMEGMLNNLDAEEFCDEYGCCSAKAYDESG